MRCAFICDLLGCVAIHRRRRRSKPRASGTVKTRQGRSKIRESRIAAEARAMPVRPWARGDPDRRGRGRDRRAARRGPRAARASRSTRVATGGDGARRRAAPDLVLLDLRLPDIDGFDVCRELRARSDVPIIVVTARGEEIDRVVGLELGADDYVVKPFGLRELVARIRAVTRRTRGARRADGARSRVGPLEVDARARRAPLDGAELALTREGVRPARAARARSRARSSAAQRILLEEVWDTHWYGPTKTIDVHVAALRRSSAIPAGSRPCAASASACAPP